jgi:hypothetical protein
MTEQHYAHGWLAAILPAAAERFRVADATLAGVLAGAGASVGDDEPDVEIVAVPEEVRGDAALAVVTIDPPPRGRGTRAGRAAGRLARSLQARLRSRRAQSSLRRAGYAQTAVVRWDVTQRVQLPFLPPVERSLAERVPRRAVVLGHRGERAPTVLEAALAAAARDSRRELRPRWASIQAGTALAAVDSALLRVAIGPAARAQIEDQVAALETLRQSDVPPSVEGRVPWLLAHGRTGLADWSLERLLPGSRPGRLMTALVDDCLSFLVGLHRVRAGGPGRSFAELAATVALVSEREADVVHALGERLDAELAGLERGFGHGDFFAGNLLAEGDRLTGVLDWDAAGPGRVPLLDLLHLQLTRDPYGPDENWGRAVVERLLPSARSGGDPLVRRYAAELGLDLDPRTLEALVYAYWLEYAAYQLRAHPDRLSSAGWIAGNVRLVAREAEAFTNASGHAGARAARTRRA